MRTDLVEMLRSRRGDIRARWAALLRVDRPTTPLANPETLVHLIDWTLEEVQRAILLPSNRHRIGRVHGPREYRACCTCEQNPFLLYFVAGEQALREALILAQVATPDLTPGERDAALEELNLVLHLVAQREIEAFCGLCQHRNAPTCAERIRVATMSKDSIQSEPQRGAEGAKKDAESFNHGSHR